MVASVPELTRPAATCDGGVDLLHGVCADDPLPNEVALFLGSACETGSSGG